MTCLLTLTQDEAFVARMLTVSLCVATSAPNASLSASIRAAAVLLTRVCI